MLAFFFSFSFFTHYIKILVCDQATTCSGNGDCNVNGTCSCLPGYDGYNCSSCVPNYFGEFCNVRMSFYLDFCFLLFSSYFVTYYWVDCDAPSTCHGQGVCNTTTGSCECQGNFVGKDCYMCMPPHYGPSCDICTLLSSSLFLFVFFNIVL